MYTSGTTGLPKGAIHTHDSVEWSVLTVLASVDVRIRDRFAISLPLFHVGALNPMACCVYRGTTMIMLRQFDAERIWDVIRYEQVTTTLAVALDEAAVLAHSTGKLARFKQPKRAVFVDVIPRAATGKALKRFLREQFPLMAPE